MYKKKTGGTSLSNVFKVKVIETSMSKYAMHVYRHMQFECHNLNIVREISIIDPVQVKKSSSITIRRNDREVVDLYTQDNANGLH